MIPFARVLNYNNKAQIPAGIKKIQGCSSVVYVLDEEGNLYGAGASSYGLLVTASTTNTYKWTLISTGVDYFWLSDYSSLIKHSDGRWLYLGSQRCIGNGGTKYTSFLDITSSMGVVVYDDAIPENTDIQMTFDAMYYLNKSTRTLYARGINQFYSFGTGNTTPSDVFIQLRTSVTEMATASPAGCMYRNTSGDYVITGNTNNSSESWLKYNSFTVLKTGSSHKFMSGYAGGWIVNTWSETWALGKNNVGMFGTGTTNVANTPTTISNSSTLSSKGLKGTVYGGTMTGLLLLSDGLYSAGLNTFGAASGAYPSSSYVFLKSVLPEGVTPQDILFYSSSGNTSIFCTKDDVYACGARDVIPGFPSTGVLVYTKIPDIKSNLL